MIFTFHSTVAATTTTANDGSTATTAVIKYSPSFSLHNKFSVFLFFFVYQLFICRPGLQAPSEFEKKPITEKQKAMIEKLKSRPRRRPDWSDMMKEVEGGKKLKHVECNDRSQPILKSETITNIKGQFIYETEKANVHNALLKQIQFGIKLKTVKTNDRSKPVLDGLRKFRKQMTIEEQIQKSESRAQLAQTNNEVGVS